MAKRHDRSRQMHAKTDRCFLPAANQQPHKWGRFAVCLPGQSLEVDFPKKVLAHARLRRNCPQSVHEQISSVLPSPNVSKTLSTNTWTNHSSSSRRPTTAPEYSSVEPRYLLTARVSQGDRDLSMRPFSLFPRRPYTAPEFQSIDSVPVIVEEPRVMQIVESPTSFTIDTPAGPEKIPRYHWLVLDPLSTPESCTSFAGRSLAGTLGGTIPAKGGELLHLVPEDRLHVVAAEANFKRASRGTSSLTLRHAAHAMELLSLREREVATGAMSIPLQSCPSSLGKLASEGVVLGRLHRASRLVTNAAVAARSREEHSFNSLPAALRQATSRKPATMHRILKGNAQLQKGVQCLDDFNEFMLHKFGNSIRAWFMLDPEENMQLGEKLFVTRVLDLGFRGDVVAMYRYIDCDRSGSVSILELDSHAAILLARFKVFIDTHFGDTEACFKRLDRHRAGRIKVDDLICGLEKVNYDGGSEVELFDLLDRQGFGYVMQKDLSYLRKWKPQPYLFVEANNDLLKRIKEGFILIHGNPLWRTWRTVLDADCSMRVSWDEFVPAIKKLTKQLAVKAPGLVMPKSEEEIATAWRAVDDDCSGWIALKEFDPDCFKCLKSFKEWAVREYGSVIGAMKKIDGNSNGMAPWELRKSETRPNAYPGDVDALFFHLDLDGGRTLGMSELKFLDEWDIAWEEYEENSKGRRRQTMCAAAVGVMESVLKRSNTRGLGAPALPKLHPKIGLQIEKEEQLEKEELEKVIPNVDEIDDWWDD